MQPSTASSPSLAIQVLYSASPAVSSATGRRRGGVGWGGVGALFKTLPGFQLGIKSHLRKTGLPPLAFQGTIYHITQSKHMPSKIFSKAAEAPASPTEEALAVLSGASVPGVKLCSGHAVCPSSFFVL